MSNAAQAFVTRVIIYGHDSTISKAGSRFFSVPRPTNRRKRGKVGRIVPYIPAAHGFFHAGKLVCRQIEPVSSFGSVYSDDAPPTQNGYRMTTDAKWSDLASLDGPRTLAAAGKLLPGWVTLLLAVVIAWQLARIAGIRCR